MLLDISVLRKELEKTGYLDRRMQGVYEYYLLDEKHVLMLVDHPITAKNRANVLNQALRDLCPADHSPTWREYLHGNSSNKTVIIMGRTTQKKSALSLPPRFRSVSLHPNGNTILGARYAAVMPTMLFAFYLIDEDKSKVILREMGYFRLTMSKYIKAFDHAIQDYIQILKQYHEN